MPLRTFVALPLPPEVRTSLAELIEHPSREDPSALRWVDPQQAHLTLAFLGDLEAEAVTTLQARVRRVSREAAPFASELSAAGAFPTPARARVLWLGWGEGAQHVSDLHARLAAALAEGFELEHRRFTPHVTLARARAPVDLRATVHALRDWRSASWQVTAIDVMASRLTPHGALHARLERCPLGAGGAPDDDAGGR